MKATLLISITIILLLFNGCVFKRLLEFKKQMETPESFISFEKKGILIFKKPVLEIDDLELLSGIYPTKIEQISPSKKMVSYSFIRDENQKFNLEYKCIFINEKLKEIKYPEQFFNQVSSGFAFTTLKSFGRSDLNNTKSWKVKAKNALKNIFIPSRSLVKKLVGPPTNKKTFALTEYYTYLYRHPTENGNQMISISYEFSKKNQRLSRLFIKLPDRNWEFGI